MGVLNSNKSVRLKWEYNKEHYCTNDSMINHLKGTNFRDGYTFNTYHDIYYIHETIRRIENNYLGASGFTFKKWTNESLPTVNKIKDDYMKMVKLKEFIDELD